MLDGQFEEGEKDKYPVIHYLQYFAKDHDIINEDNRDNYTFDVWCKGMQFLIDKEQ